MKTKPDKFIKKLRNPQNYTGLEINVNKKGFARNLINICLVFPDLYEIGMSHYGIKFLYAYLKRMAEVNVERAFLPDFESIKIFQELKYPLFSLESKTPLREFDLIGFSVLSEMNYTNILQILDLADIPVFQKERSKKDPLIAAGGISIAANPEPMRDFLDLIAVGEGEVIFPHITAALSIPGFKQRERKEQLEVFNKIKGIYVPSLVKTKKCGDFWVPIMPENRIKKQISNKQVELKYYEDMIVPVSDTVFNRLDVEIARGCPHNCRFCQAKSYYSPFRIGKTDHIIEYIKNGLEKTGFDSVSLASLSSGDYPGIDFLFSRIEEILPACVSLSVSSLRPSAVSNEILNSISQLRKTGITIVAEAGTQRLRNIINKNVTDEEIFKAVKTALENNWQRIKLYFMLGLPHETTEDIEAIIQLLIRVHEISKEEGKTLRIHASFSSFVPKPHTPLQRAKRENKNLLFKKIHLIKSKLGRYRNINLDFHNIKRSIVETILARGDKQVGELIYQAYLQGEILSAWDNFFNFMVWEDLIDKLNLKIFLKEIREEEVLPWNFIQLNYKEEFLKREAEKALKAEPTLPCTAMDCNTCQGCYSGKRDIHNDKKINYKFNSKPKNTPAFNKIRLFYEKTGYFSFLSHLSMMKYIERIIRMSQLDFKYSRVYHPRIKMSPLPSLPVFAAGFNEVVEVFLNEKLSSKIILDTLNSISEDFKFKKVQLAEGLPALSKDIKAIVYEMKAENIKGKIEIATEFFDDHDIVNWQGNTLNFTLNYLNNGQQRFAKIYSIIDPERKNTDSLIRKEVIFKHDFKD